MCHIGQVFHCCYWNCICKKDVLVSPNVFNHDPTWRRVFQAKHHYLKLLYGITCTSSSCIFEVFNVDCNGRNVGTRKEACFLCFIIAPTVILPTVGCDTVQVHTLGWCLHFATEDILHTRHALYLQQVNVYSIQQAQNGKSKQRVFFRI